MNNQPQTDLAAKEKEQYDYFVGQAEALKRLENNPDFKKVILEGYFKDRPINITSVLGSDYVRRNGNRGELIEELNAISMLQQHFITVAKLGEVMPDGDEVLEDE